jgi:hypothetical protein
MIGTWTQHLSNDAKGKKELEETIKRSSIALGRLKDIVIDNINTIDKIELTLSNYDNPNWSYKQAFLNGKRASYQEILNLLDI